MTSDDYDQWSEWLVEAQKAVANWTNEDFDPPAIEDINNAFNLMCAASKIALPAPRRRFMRAGGISHTWRANKRNVTIQFQDGDIIVSSSKPKSDGMMNLKANSVALDSIPPMKLAIEIRDFLADARYGYPILSQ